MIDRLMDPRQSGVYRIPRRGWAAAGVRAVQVDLGQAPDKAALLAAFARELGFPDWFGSNWDALEDCLTDLSWLEPGEVVLILEGSEALPPDDLGVLIDVLSACAEHWQARGRPFFALFAGGPATLPELGAEPGA